MIVRTLIYARFSSQLQNSRSIEDQIAICRDRCEREGWHIVDVFTDYAISGAAGIGEGQRPGLAALLTRVEAGGIDQVLAEATDRISRHQGDSYEIRERLSFARCRLFTLSDGEVTDISGTFKGLMDAQFRKELGAKIKRGQRGTVKSGRIPAGIAFGYRVANRIDTSGRAIRGLREIDPEQADIVRRIFREYAAGVPPRTIVQRLNAEGIPGPRGDRWRATTIRADNSRGNGLLQNALYIGRIVHNRTSKVVEPLSRKVRIRPNPQHDWITEDVPHLRILDDDLWNAVQTMRADLASQPALTYMRRPKRMLSGLGTCGVCGAGWIIVSNGYWGCGGLREGNNCTNDRRISTKRYEERVLSGLRRQMLAPELVEIFVKEYHAEAARNARSMANDRARTERQLRDARAKVERLVIAISEGAGEFTEIRDALVQARADRDRAEATLAELDAPAIIALHPTIAAAYRREVERLDELLADPEGRDEAVPLLRAMIERLTITPGALARTVNIELAGRLSAMLAIAAGRPVPAPITLQVERVKGIEPSS